MAESKGELTLLLLRTQKKQDDEVTGVQWDAPVGKHVKEETGRKAGRKAGRNIMVAGIGAERAEYDRII